MCKAKKPDFTTIVDLEGLKFQEAPFGKRFITYPSGKPIAIKSCKILLTVGTRIFAAGDLGAALIGAHKKGLIDLTKYGYQTCYRCGGSGKKPEFSHVYEGTCFKCHGYGII